MPMIKPEWLRKKLHQGDAVRSVETSLRRQRLHTICEEACCPNRSECFARGVATFLIMGDICTRNCLYCAVEHGKPRPLDMNEPQRLAMEVKELNLRFVVVTSVTRDDLPDGGAGHFALVIAAIRYICPDVGIEVLIPDFLGSPEALHVVVEARPEVINHNVETVPRLFPEVRPQADYRRSLALLAEIKASRQNVISKSGLMVGLGETRAEVEAVMTDLRAVGCDMLTIGQYLSPSKKHYPVAEYIHPDVFEDYRRKAESLGFKAVASAPFVRSSYMAETNFQNFLTR